jgi:hypothetical protein
VLGALHRLNLFLGNAGFPGRLPRANVETIWWARSAQQLVDAMSDSPREWVAVCTEGAVQAPLQGTLFAIRLGGRSAPGAPYDSTRCNVLAFDDAHLAIVQFMRPRAASVWTRADVARAPFTVERGNPAFHTPKLVGGPTDARLWLTSGDDDRVVAAMVPRGWLDPARTGGRP